MKTLTRLWSLTLLAAVMPESFSQNRPVTSRAPQVVESGRHHQTWEYETLKTENGRQISQKHSYVELQSGMNAWSPEEGKWKPASAEIELVQNGAVARKAQHRVIFAPMVNDPNGAVDLLTPGNQRLRSRIAGLAFTELGTGRSAFVAELKDSIGQLIGRTQVQYPDAFDDVKAEVRYTMDLAYFEQDVVLREQLPPPESFGMNSARTRFEIWTEFFQPPKPIRRHWPNQDDPNRSDEELDFGKDTMFFGLSEMYLDPGVAAPAENPGPPSGLQPGNRRGRPIRADKHWVELEGRSFLIESVPFEQLNALLSDLPKRTARAAKDSDSLKRLAAQTSTKDRRVPISLASAGNLAAKTSLLASIKPGLPSREPGVVLDYVLAGGGTDFTFRSDTTYWVRGNLYYYGTTTFEGGTVIKFDPYTGGSTIPRIVLFGPLNCRTRPYWPAIFTARDDDSVGEIIPGSTGTPSGTYGYEHLLLWTYYQTPIDVHDLRFHHGYVGFDAGYEPQVTLRDSQFVQCAYAILGYYTASSFPLRNLLVWNCSNTILAGLSRVIRAEHLTVDGGSQLAVNYDGSATFYLTNCLITGVGNTSGFTGSNNQVLGGSSGVFQTVGGGWHYLANGSPYRNAGTLSINSQLLADLKNRTTFPPVLLTGSITVDTTLSPQAQRDVDVPDLGYHYEPLDYLITAESINSGISVANASLILTNGVAVGYYGFTGIDLLGGGKLISEGSPVNRNRITRYRTVQEKPRSNLESYSHSITVNGAYSPTPEVRLRHTGLTLIASHNMSTHLLSPSNGPMTVELRDCGFGGSVVSLDNAGGLTLDILNCSFERVNGYFQGANVSVRNNTFFAGIANFNANAGQTYTVKDNLFDQTSIYNATSGSWYLGNNGYLSGYSRLTPNGPNDVILFGGPGYQTGPLGHLYLSPGSPLINTGSRTADQAGLYHHTTQTGQTKETTSTVDIGFHYVALNGQSQPMDFDGDGLPDYLEDRNGNGLFDSALGETDWTSGGGPSPTTALRVFTLLK